MNKNRILSHLLVLGSGRIATLIVSSVGTILGTRYLGPTRVGELAFAGAIIWLLGQVNAMGMETYLIRTVARAPERCGTLVGTALFVRFVMAIPVPVVLAVYIHVAHLSSEVATVAYLLAIGMILWSFTVVLIWALQGLERMSFVAGSDVFLKLLGLVATIAIIVLHGSVIAFAAMSPANTILLFILTLRYAGSQIRLSWHISRAGVRELIVGSLAFWAKDVTMTVYGYIDSVILGSIAGVHAVGFYDPPTRVFSYVLAVPNIVGNATLPLLSRLGVEAGQQDFVRAGRKTLQLLVLVGVPLVVGLATFARPVITLLFGPDFGPSVPVLVVLSLCLLPMFLNSQFAFILTGRDQQWRWTRIMMVSTVANVLINLVMIPLAIHYWHNGALGAAFAMLGTEILSVTYGAVLLRQVVMERSVARTVVGSLVAGAAQLGIVLLMGSSMVLLVVGETLGVAAYATVVIALGAAPRNDIAVVWETARRRVPGLA